MPLNDCFENLHFALKIWGFQNTIDKGQVKAVACCTTWAEYNAEQLSGLWLGRLTHARCIPCSGFGEGRKHPYATSQFMAFGVNSMGRPVLLEARGFPALPYRSSVFHYLHCLQRQRWFSLTWGPSHPVYHQLPLFKALCHMPGILPRLSVVSGWERGAV